jgi:TPR repeat protein
MRKFLCIISLTIVFAIFYGCSSPEDAIAETSLINKLPHYKNIEALKQIQKAVLSPVYDDENIIALNILRQTMYALGQDMALEVAPDWDRTVLRNKEEEKWLQVVEKMADDGDPFFQVVLAILYDKGCGVPVNKNKAVELWRQASDNGFGPASLSLGKIYEFLSQNYESVPQDFHKAAELYLKAGEWGVPEGWYNLGCMYNTEKLERIQLNKAMGYWEKSAAMGHAWSQYNLGFYYTQGGPGVQQNRTLGEKWLREAANNGHGKAIYVLSESYNTGAKVGDTFYDINLE